MNSNRQPPREQRDHTDHAGDAAWANADDAGQGYGSKSKLLLLAAAIAQIGEAVVITDTSATIQYVNPAFTRMTGYSAAEAVGQNIRLLKSGRQDPVYYRRLWETILAGRVWEGELINRRKDGTLYADQMGITPVRDPSGIITNFIAIKQDVTERRATEAALHSSEKRLEAAQQVAPLGSWELDVQSHEFRGSAGFFRIFDWPPAEAALPFSRVTDAIPAADCQRIQKAFDRAVHAGEPFDLEHQIILRDQTVRVVRSRGQAVAALKGRPALLAGTTLDITDGKRAHEKLRQSEAKFRSLVANIPDVVWSSAVDGRTQYISPNVERVFGFTSEEICANGAELWFGRIYPDDHSRVVETFEQLFAAGQPFDVEYRVQRKDGQWIWIHDRAYRTYEKDGVRYADGVFSDITERKQIEQAIQQSEHFLQSTLDALSSHVAILDASGEIVAVNAAWDRFAAANGGRLLACGVGSNYLAVCSEASPSSAEARAAAEGIQRIITGTLGEFSLEYSCHSPQQKRWFVLRVTPFADPRPGPVVLAHENITNRKLAEEAVRESEKRYRLLFERNLAGVFRTTLAGLALECNQAAARMFGYDSPEEVLALPVASLYYQPSHRDDFLAQLKTEKSLTNYEMKIRRKDGEPAWLIGNMSLVDDDSAGGAIIEGTLIDITGRKQAEEEMYRSRQMLQSILDAIPQRVFWKDRNSLYLGCNRALAADAGANSPAEIIGKSDFELSWSGMAEHYRADDRLVMERGSAKLDFEERQSRPDRRILWLRTNKLPLRDRAGNVTGVIGTYEDITGQKKAEQELAQAEEKYRSLVLNIPDVAWTVDAAGQIAFISPSIEKISGYSDTEIERQGAHFFLETVHPDDVTRVRTAQEALFRRGEEYDVEYRIRHKHGEWIWMRDRSVATYEKKGMRYADGLLSDITERKRAEEARERLAAVVDSSDDAILSKTLEGVITAWNPGAEKLFGYSAAEAVGKPIQMLLPEDRAHEESEILARIARGEHVQHFETIRLRKDGKAIAISATISPIKDSRGAIVGASKIARDISERKRAEEEMRKAKEVAEDANRAKSQFLANMSHEIRTPMNGVIGVAGLLLDTRLTPEQRRYAEIVRSSGEALLKVINDILDFSRIEARKLVLETTEFDLQSVLQDAAAVLEIRASEKGLALSCELEAETPRRLRGDPGRLRQVLVNLLANAVKFTERGQVAVKVRREAEDGGAATLRFTVSDTGIGFQQDRAATLFEPFVQADGSSTRRYGGTGLGLAISRQLVEMMGGKIGARGEEGKGATFWFTAVFEKQTQSGGLVGAKNSAAAASARLALQGAVQMKPEARILLAEDNLTNQEVAAAMLKKLGYSADLVADGAQALRALRETDYHAVLMDCEMPEMDGYEATRRIRAGGDGIRNPDIPIVAITADAMTGDREKCLRSGMSDYLAKPIELHQLAEVLEKWLSLPASGGELKSPAEPSPTPTETVFDQEELLARLMGDKGLAATVITGFLTDAPKQLRTLKNKLNDGDADGARLQAHTLKGAAATISAGALRALCVEMQKAAAAKDMTHALALLPRLQEQFELLQRSLEHVEWV
jgi:PAS domain S-box-containing protein